MSRATLTVFYGPKQVTDDAVLDKIAESIDNHKDYQVSNDSMGGDPQAGTYKYAMVYYALAAANSPVRGRVAGEGKSLSFGTDIQWLRYGDNDVTVPTVYAAAYDAFFNKTPYPVNNNTMGGDPAPGTVKYGVASYYKNGAEPDEESRREGESFAWDGHN